MDPWGDAWNRTNQQGETVVTGIVIIILLCVMLFWLVGLFYSVQKGLNEIIKGLSVIHEQLIGIQKTLSKKSREE